MTAVSFNFSDRCVSHFVTVVVSLDRCDHSNMACASHEHATSKHDQEAQHTREP